MSDKNEKDKKLKEKVKEVETDQVKYWHEGWAGMVVLKTGKEPLTDKPIEKFIYFTDHFYATEDKEEIKLLDAICDRAPNIMKRFDDYQIMVDSTPKTVAMEINGKKVIVPMDALTDSFKEQLAKEELPSTQPTLKRDMLTS